MIVRSWFKYYPTTLHDNNSFWPSKLLLHFFLTPLSHPYLQSPGLKNESKYQHGSSEVEAERDMEVIKHELT